jgi:hypothetical protein
MAAKACRLGIGVTVAEPRALANFRNAFEPVSDRLERNPRARASIERIRKIDAAAAQLRPTTCSARNG